MAEIVWTEPALADLDTIADYIAIDNPTAARRPADTRLDCAAIRRDFGVTPRPWQHALGATIDQLLHE